MFFVESKLAKSEHNPEAVCLVSSLWPSSTRHYHLYLHRYSSRRPPINLGKVTLHLSFPHLSAPQRQLFWPKIAAEIRLLFVVADSFFPFEFWVKTESKEAVNAFCLCRWVPGCQRHSDFFFVGEHRHLTTTCACARGTLFSAL